MDARLHFNAVVADAHNDLLCAVVARPVDRWAAYFRERWLPQLREGGVRLQVLPVFIDRLFRPEGALRQTMRMIEAAHRVTEANPDETALCSNGAEIEAALAEGKIVFILALEGSQGVGEDVEVLETLHRLGVRIASLAHLGRTALADGSGEDDTGSRLTKGGVSALSEMERMGMLFDVSHLNVAGVEHVLEIATRPLIASHSGALAVHRHHRNLSDQHLLGVARTGGVVAVNFFGPYLHDGPPTVSALIDHLEHIVSVAGIAHVGLGPDFIRESYFDASPPGCERSLAASDTERLFIPGLDGPSGLPLLTEAIIARGWAEADIRAVLGENLRRLLVTELYPRR